MKYQENIFSASEDIASTQNAPGVELKPVVTQPSLRRLKDVLDWSKMKVSTTFF